MTLADSALPAVPPEEGAAPARPAYCGVEIALDREPLFSGAVYPTGEQAPFSASGGRRLVASAGP